MRICDKWSKSLGKKSASPDQWEAANFDSTQLRNRLTDFDEIRTSKLSPKDQPPCKMSFQSDDVGGLGEYPT